MFQEKLLKLSKGMKNIISSLLLARIGMKRYFEHYLLWTILIIIFFTYGYNEIIYHKLLANKVYLYP